MEKDTRSKLESALKLARKGFRVFPLSENSKIPAKGMTNFPNVATTNEEQIIEWWSNGHTNSNIGISTDGYLALDVDNKGVKKGDEELLRLEINEGLVLPATYEQTTPTGGRHLIYSTNIKLKNSVCKLGPGLDTRAERGYVVGSGSTIDGRDYGDNGRNVVPITEGLVSRCARSTSKSNDTTKRAPFEVNQQSAISRALFYLENEAPPSIKGAGGDQTAFTVAARIKDFGVSKSDCLDLMLDSTWHEKSGATWTAKKLSIKVDNAYRYGEKQPGIDAPEAVFKPIYQETTTTTTVVKTLFGEKGKDIEPKTDQLFLVDKILSPNAMSVIYGESNSGKTFFALDLSLHISLGQEWHGRKTVPGLVIYVAAEGGWGIRKRIKAFREYHKLQGLDFPFVLVPCPIDLLNPNVHAEELVALIRQFETEFNQKACLIVIDTLARAMGAGNENAANDMGAFVKNVDRVRQATKAHMMIIHHSGKDAAKGARGHSSLRAATDTEIEISNLPTNPGNMAKIKKQRDMEFGQPVGFKLEQIEIGLTTEGEPIYSCVVLPSNTSALKDFSNGAVKSNTLSDTGFKALQNALAWQPRPAPNELDLDGEQMVVSVADWRESFYQLAYPNQKKKKSWYEAFTRVVENLKETGHVKTNDAWAWIE